jgi:hypothetical protein
MNDLELPPIIDAQATCRFKTCEWSGITLDIKMVEGSAVTCGSCWNVVAEVTPVTQSSGK